MENQDFKYFAFISYSGKDEKWANWLHSHLEHYHIPAALCKEHPNIPKKIRPVFWYKKDLSGTKLKDALNQELGLSKYLIVICSPESSKSEWVNDEIQSFIDSGKSKYIIPFIVNGIPHSDSVDTECFPPSLRNLPREEEIRGISVKSDGKQHALVDVVATMFGVSFDTLWQRHKRRKRIIRNIWLAACLLCCLCTLCVWDYTRTKIEYYADWVDKYGVAEGITRLSQDQVEHRYYSYKFEYSRVPFGEKGFYSWRLNKVSIVNSKDVISNYIPDNHSFFYPIQEYKYVDSYVSEIINRDIYNRIAMRYTVRDGNNKEQACIIDIEGKEKRQGSAYLSSSTTTFLSDVGANESKSKIKRFHYERNENGYITKVTYHANDDDDLQESAIGDNNNIYGKVFRLDSKGRITKVSYINNEGNLVTDKYGVGSITYNNSPFEINDTIEYLGIDDNLVYNEHKFARMIVKKDKYGNPIEQSHEGVDGLPCYDYQNVSTVTADYDNNGFQKELRCYGTNGKLTYCKENFAIRKFWYDHKGRFVKVSHLDINGQPCYTSDNYHIAKCRYNQNDCIIEQSFYDVKEEPCVEKNSGVHSMRFSYDPYNYNMRTDFYGIDMQKVFSPILHYSSLVNVYDDYHNLISTEYFDSDDNPCVSKDWYHCVNYRFDKRGNLEETIFLDDQKKLCNSKDGYAKTIQKYDEYGNLTLLKWFDSENKSAYIDGASGMEYSYYPNGLLHETRYLGENDSLRLNTNWVAVERFEYDINGNCIHISYYDEHKEPCLSKEGLSHAIIRKYDDNNNVIQEEFIGVNNQKETNSYNYNTAVYKYNSINKITDINFYNVDGAPCNTNAFVHHVHKEYDKKGNEVSLSFFDKKDMPTMYLTDYHKIVKSYNNLGLLIEEKKYDKNDNPVSVAENAAISRYEYDAYGRKTRESYYNSTGRRCWQRQTDSSNSGLKVSDIRYNYDQLGNLCKIQYFSPNNCLTILGGFAVMNKLYDRYGRVIEECYFDENLKPIGGGVYCAQLCKYEYEPDHTIINIFQKNNTLFCRLHIFYKNGVVVKYKFTDANDNLIMSNLPVINTSPCAEIENIYNNKMQLIRVNYKDTNGHLFNTATGVAYTINGFDKLGRWVTVHRYDAEDKLINDNVQNSAYVYFEYDTYGNLVEQSYYDKNGKLANTPWTWSRRLSKFDEKGRTIKDEYWLPTGEIKSYAPNDSVSESPVVQEIAPEDRLIIILQVETYGQMYEKGFRGVYVILEFNDWNTTSKGIDLFVDAMMRGKSAKKHLVLLPVGNDLLSTKSSDVIEADFSEEQLSARIMDSMYSDATNRNHVLNTYRTWKGAKNHAK